MNKLELVEAIAAKAHLSKKDAEGAVEAALEVMEKELEKGHDVKISGFGVLSVKARKARVGTNPKDGKKINIPASKTVGFKASKALKERVN